MPSLEYSEPFMSSIKLLRVLSSPAGCTYSSVKVITETRTDSNEGSDMPGKRRRQRCSGFDPENS